jgi:hypothetical protein
MPSFSAPFALFGSEHNSISSPIPSKVGCCASPSVTLSGNKVNPALNSDGKASKYHVMVYTAEAIRNHPRVMLTRGGLILFALLAGGDYANVSALSLLLQ